jgi:tetratricopeptide (TPR) repeat protein
MRSVEPRPGIEVLVRITRLDRLLERLEQASSIGERRYLRDAIDRAIDLVDPASLTPAMTAALTASGADVVRIAGDAPIPPEAVTVPLVYAGLGFARLLFVEPGEREGNDAVARDALRTASRYSSARFSGALRVAAVRPEALAQIRIEGPSIGAAMVVSAVAFLERRAVRPKTAISGAIAGERVVRVGGLDAKVAGVHASGVDVRRWIVPAQNVGSVRSAVPAGVEVTGVRTVRELLAEALEAEPLRVAFAAEIEAARRRFERGWEGYRWPLEREALERLVREIPSYRPDLAIDALTMLGALHRHLGSLSTSLRLFDDANERAAAMPEAVPDGPLVRLHRHRALTLQRLGRFADASNAARAAVKIARGGRLVIEELKAQGSLGIVLVSQGRFDASIRAFEAARTLGAAHDPASLPRTLGYLTEVLSRAGRSKDAASVFRLASARLSTLDRDAARSVEVWLRMHRGAGLVVEGRFRAAERVLDREPVLSAIAGEPLPGLFARRWLALALANGGGDRRRAYRLLGQSHAAYGRTLSPYFARAVALNALTEAMLRLEHRELDEDAMVRTEQAVGLLSRDRDEHGEHGPAFDRLGRALRAGPDGARFVRALIESLDRIA